MSVSLRDAVKFKKGYDQVMARWEAELDGITGGLECSEHGGYSDCKKLTSEIIIK